VTLLRRAAGAVYPRRRDGAARPRRRLV